MSRKKVTIQARELSEMDVSRVSLVKRGANRIPFRIVKSDGESTMSLNLSNLFLRKREILPSVIAVVLQPDADVELYSKALVEAGFEVDHVEETDEANTLMLKADSIPEDVTLYKVSAGAALVIAGIQKGLQTFPDSNDFAENIASAGFLPSFRVGHQILGETIGNIVFSEGDAAETKSAVMKALNDFSGFIEGVMSAIPEEAFKCEDVVLAVEKGLLNEQETSDSIKQKAKDAKKAKNKNGGKNGDKAKAKKDDSDEDEGDAISDEITALTEDPEKQKAIAALIAKDDGGNGDDDENGDDENGGDDEDAGDDETEIKKAQHPVCPAGQVFREGRCVAKAKKDDDTDDDDKQAALLKSIGETIAAAIAPVSEAVAGVKQELSERLDALEAQVKKTDEALNGSVNSEEADDDSTPRKKSAKPEEVNWDNVLDFGDVEIS